MNSLEAHNELASAAAAMEATGYAAMGSLSLQENNFAWFTGEILHPMPRQAVLRNSTHEADTYSSSATFFGGKATDIPQEAHCGNILARICEPLTDGTKHESGRNEFPVPYIRRLVALSGNVITVDTPTRHAPLGEGPVVLEGCGRGPRFRKTAVYDTQTGKLELKSGNILTDRRGSVNDETIGHDAFEMPEDILQVRIGEVLRSIKMVTAIFEKVAWQDYLSVRWQIVDQPPQRRR